MFYDHNVNMDTWYEFMQHTAYEYMKVGEHWFSIEKLTTMLPLTHVLRLTLGFECAFRPPIEHEWFTYFIKKDKRDLVWEMARHYNTPYYPTTPYDIMAQLWE